jgi:galactonate dehydratase
VQEVAPGLPEVVDGFFDLPKGPGLGIELDDDAVAAHPKQDVHFNLFAEGWEKREGARR